MLRVRDLRPYEEGRPPRRFEPSAVFHLGPRQDILLPPDPERTPRALELDLAIQLQGGLVAMVLPTRALLDAGYEPMLPVEIIDHRDTFDALSLLVRPIDDRTIEIRMGTPIAKVLLLPAPAQQLIDDPVLDDHLPQDPDARFGVYLG